MISAMEFQAAVELGGKTATGIEVPADVVAGLGKGNRPSVAVTINGYTYRTTVARMGGRFMVPLSAENRAGAGAEAGGEGTVGNRGGRAPRGGAVPGALAP